MDISLVKSKVKPRNIRGAISNLRDASQEVIIDFISEDKGLGWEGVLKKSMIQNQGKMKE